MYKIVCPLSNNIVSNKLKWPLKGTPAAAITYFTVVKIYEYTA